MGHIYPGKWPPIPTAEQPWLGLTYLPWHQTYSMPTTLDWLNNHVLEDQHGVCHLSVQGLHGSVGSSRPLMTIGTWMVTVHSLSGSMELTAAG